MQEEQITDPHPPRAQWDHNEEKPIQVTCRTCGSADVRRDAWAEWDVQLQKWVLGAVFDDGHCEVCEGESRLEDTPLDEYLGDKLDREAIPGGFDIPGDYEIEGFDADDEGFGAYVYRGEGSTEALWSDSGYMDVTEAKDAARRAIVQDEVDA